MGWVGGNGKYSGLGRGINKLFKKQGRNKLQYKGKKLKYFQGNGKNVKLSSIFRLFYIKILKIFTLRVNCPHFLMIFLNFAAKMP